MAEQPRLKSNRTTSRCRSASSINPTGVVLNRLFSLGDLRRDPKTVVEGHLPPDLQSQGCQNNNWPGKRVNDRHSGSPQMCSASVGRTGHIN